MGAIAGGAAAGAGMAWLAGGAGAICRAGAGLFACAGFARAAGFLAFAFGAARPGASAFRVLRFCLGDAGLVFRLFAAGFRLLAGMVFAFFAGAFFAGFFAALARFALAFGAFLPALAMQMTQRQ
jgi:hypothetical protein